jgi:phosphate starvation-inducible protein PhoH and related proteins
MGKPASKAKPSDRRDRRSDRRKGRSNPREEYIPENNDPRAEPPRRHVLECQSPAQKVYLTHLESKVLTIASGCAGTGKTFVAASHASKLKLDREISKIIVTRPVVESKGAGAGLGFLPGTKEEKTDPYFEPLKQVFLQWFGKSYLENMLRNEDIQYVPLEFIRGMTFDNAYVILDEAQNTTPGQMKMFLTRIGKYSRVAINGDSDQKDIKGESGLEDILKRLRGMDDVGFVEFQEKDVIRSTFVKEILKRYRTS